MLIELIEDDWRMFDRRRIRGSSINHLTGPGYRVVTNNHTLCCGFGHRLLKELLVLFVGWWSLGLLGAATIAGARVAVVAVGELLFLCAVKSGGLLGVAARLMTNWGPN